MEPECYPSSILPKSSRLFLDYSESSVPLAPFYPVAASSHDWMSQGRPLSAAHRSRLADLLTEQNHRFGGGDAAAANIARLRSGASAVVTGQQVALFGGPLYTLLKAATAIARARAATEAGFDTVPVFWLASEDHDFAEVATVGLPGPAGLVSASIAPVPAQPVPVGGVPLGPSVEAALDAAEALLGPSDAMRRLRQVYRAEDTLAQAFGSLVARLFAPWGLVVIDAASREFHSLGAPVLAAAIKTVDVLHTELQRRDAELAARGYHSQVMVSEQSTPLFLLNPDTGARTPLRRTAGESSPGWKAGSQRFTSNELDEILKVTPERLSPNALLRPVFQDAILPTSAYVSGPAEIAYFAQSEVLYRAILGHVTAVLPRLSATLIVPKAAASMRRFEVTLPEAMTTADALTQRLAARTMPIEGKRLLSAAGTSLDQELSAVTQWMESLDAGLGRAATTAASKMRYQMNRLGRLAARHQMEKETSLRRHAETIVDAVYPGGHLQERCVGGVAFLAAHGEDLLKMLVDAAKDGCPGHKLLPL